MAGRFCARRDQKEPSVPASWPAVSERLDVTCLAERLSHCPLRSESDRSDLLRRRVAMRNCGHRVKNNVARVSFVLVDAKHKQVSSRHTGGNQ
jgi:two-component sensor histidine kinase